MLLLLAAATLAYRDGILASPVNALPELLCHSANDPQNQRSIWSIIRSCFATTFLCAWVAMHPNVPSSKERGVMRFVRHLKLMGVSLLGPEFIIMWAFRQRLAAGNIYVQLKRKLCTCPNIYTAFSPDFRSWMVHHPWIFCHYGWFCSF